MAPKQSVKRPLAKDYVRDFDAQRAGTSSSKKPRFDARNPSTLAQSGADDDDAADAETDAILELDEIGRAGTQTKRNAVRLDGYDSDSSNEGFDGRAAEKRAAEKKQKQKSKDEEDADMFADLADDFADGDGDDDDDADGSQGGADGKRRKEVRFLDAKDIEGQVASSRGGGHVSADFRADAGRGANAAADEDEDDSDAASEVDDEERDRADGVDAELGAGAKKAHAPKLDAFNMRSEAGEGRFDETGNFVRNAADPFAVHDAWMEGTGRGEMRRAREAHEKREAERRQRDLADDAVSVGEILAQLIGRLEVGETVLEALARYGGAKKAKPKPKWQTKKKNSKGGGGMDVDEEKDADKDDPEEQARKEAVESITAAADQLMTRGQDEVYEAERELLIRQYKRETGEDWKDDSRSGAQGPSDDAATSQWEYQWADARDGGEIHGPYAGTEMAAWTGAGYFGEGVQFRQVGSNAWLDVAPDFV